MGINNLLIITEVHNQSNAGLELRFNYTAVPDVFYTLGLETSYKLSLIGGWLLTPAILYLGQFDDLNAATEVAHLRGPGKAAGFGYRDPTSLDSSLFNTRLDFEKGRFRLKLGYSSPVEPTKL